MSGFLFCVNIALRRDTSDLLHWTAGNVPYGFGELPEGWTPEQIGEWGKVWDDMLSGDLAERSKIKWGPHGMNFHEFQERNKGNEDWKFYEWSSRRACAIFGVAPTAYAGQVNRATAETAEEAQGELAEEPLCQWFEQLITTEIQTVQGQPGLCFRFITEKQHNELEQAQANKEKIFSGQISLDAVLNEAGADEIGIPPFVLVPGQGIVYLKGQNPEYIKKYAKFFKLKDEEDAAAVPPALAQAAGLLPGKAAAPGDEKKKPVDEKKPSEKEAPAPAAAAPTTKARDTLADLRKWRRIARRCLVEGSVQKSFESDLIPRDIRKMISVRVETAKEGGCLDETFDAAMQDVIKRDLADVGGTWKRPWGDWLGLHIYRVDGPAVRARFFVDFTEGGNPAAYMWLPEDEVWIEQTDNAADDAAKGWTDTAVVDFAWCSCAACSTALAVAPAWMPVGWPIVPPPNCSTQSSPNRSSNWCIWPAWMPPEATGITFFRSAQSWS